MEDEDQYTEVLGGSEKRTRFESAQTVNERQAAQEEQHEQEILNNERMQAYLSSFADANAAKEERMQQMHDAASSEDSKMAEIIAKMDARDEAPDAQMRTEGRQMGELINKLTTMTATGADDSYNKDRNPKRVRPGKGRGGGGPGRGGRGGGGRGGGGRGNGPTSGTGRPAPAYSQKYKAADGGGARIDHKTAEFSEIGRAHV